MKNVILSAILLILSPLAACAVSGPGGTGGVSDATTSSVGSSAASSGTGGTGGGIGGCPAGMKKCGNDCAPIGPDTGCNNVPCEPCKFSNATAVCAGGACAIDACVLGWSDCNGDPADGCEVHTATDADHCGGCNVACQIPNATPACSAGACVIGSCSTGFADCNTTVADGCERNIKSDPAACGSCGHVCPTGEGCEGGTCYSCSGILSASGSNDQLPSFFNTWPVWRYQPAHDTLVSSIVPSINNPQNLNWHIAIYADDGSGAHPKGVLSIANSGVGGTFSTPFSMKSSEVYWIGLLAGSTMASQFMYLTTKDSPGSEMFLFDGVTWEQVTDQRPSTLAITGVCQ